MEPVTDLYQGNETDDDDSSSSPPLPPPSHTLFVPIHPDMQNKVHGGKQLVYGYTPALQVMTYAIHNDHALQNHYRSRVENAHSRMEQNPIFFVEFPEGNVLAKGPKSAFRPSALEVAKAKAKLLDPHGLFYGMEDR